MKKLLGFIFSFLISVNSFAAITDVEWREGTGANTLVGTTNISDIDTASLNNIVKPLDRLMTDYKSCLLSYASASTLTLSAGSVVCKNTAATIKRMRNNPSSTTITWSNLDTGSEDTSTTYYVYAVADVLANTTFTILISENATTPTGATYYLKLGSFYNDSSGNITIIKNINNNQLGTWETKSTSTTYQATTDGFVVGYAPKVRGVEFIVYSDSSSSPSTIRQRGYEAPDQTGPSSLGCPIRAGDYWKVTYSATDAGSPVVYWIPLEY